MENLRGKKISLRALEPEDLEWRMYGIVPYNISDIQKGIQFGHAVQEYNNLMIRR